MKATGIVRVDQGMRTCGESCVEKRRKGWFYCRADGSGSQAATRHTEKMPS